MLKFHKSSICLIFCFVLSLYQSNCSAGQLDFRINFSVTRSENLYSYRSVSDSVDFSISPGGTMYSPGGAAIEFPSFSEFEADIVGQWTVFDFAGNIATFQIQSFDENDFPVIELNSPMNGDYFDSGTFVPYNIMSSTGFGFLGEFWDPNLIDVDVQVGSGLTGTLEPGVLEAPVIIDGFTFRTFTDIVTNIDTSQVNFDIDNATTLQSNLAPTEIFFFVNSVLGDVNRDGDVNLLDVDPFIALVQALEYQFEADIDGNGQVDLLDVMPFVELLQD